MVVYIEQVDCWHCPASTPRLAWLGGQAGGKTGRSYNCTSIQPNVVKYGGVRVDENTQSAGGGEEFNTMWDTSLLATLCSRSFSS